VLFLQQPLGTPEVVAPGTLGAELLLTYSNSILVAEDAGLVLDVDQETAELTALLRYGIGPDLEVQLDVPAYLDWGGILDRPIERFEKLVHARNNWRLDPPRPRNTAHFWLITRGDRRGYDRQRQESLGDVRAGLQWLLAAQEGAAPAVALRGMVKAPTGRPTFGSGSWDLGASLLLGWSWRPAALRVQLDAARPGGGLDTPGVPARPYGSLQAALAIPVGDRVTLHAQASGHRSPLHGTGLSPIDKPTYYLLGGVTVAVSPGIEAELGLVENVWSPHWGADFTVLLGLRTRGSRGRGRRPRDRPARRSPARGAARRPPARAG
jgi:hypothetical protein